MTNIKKTLGIFLLIAFFAWLTQEYFSITLATQETIKYPQPKDK